MVCEQRVDARLGLRWLEVILCLPVFLAYCVIELDGHASIRIVCGGKPQSPHEVIARIDQTSAYDRRYKEPQNFFHSLVGDRRPDRCRTLPLVSFCRESYRDLGQWHPNLQRNNNFT